MALDGYTTSEVDHAYVLSLDAAGTASVAIGVAALAALLAAAGAALAFWPPARVGLPLLVAGGVYADRHLRARLRRLAAARAGEDVGTFARAFDRRAAGFDPRVVRAVWDALSGEAAAVAGVPVPLRPADRLEDDLGFDLEDVEDTVRREVCVRAGRDMDAASRRPPAVIVTVGDVVRYVTGLPRRAAV